MKSLIFASIFTLATFAAVGSNHGNVSSEGLTLNEKDVDKWVHLPSFIISYGGSEAGIDGRLIKDTKEVLAKLWIEGFIAATASARTTSDHGEGKICVVLNWAKYYFTTPNLPLQESNKYYKLNDVQKQLYLRNYILSALTEKITSTMYKDKFQGVGLRDVYFEEVGEKNTCLALKEFNSSEDL